MNRIKVSVIVPIYNVEKYLAQCLDSVINQSLKNIEIICVDDGSTDNSLNIVKRYALKDSRIKFFTKKNSGYGNTMNIGLDNSHGEYIGIVESDDYVERNMFKDLYDAAYKYKVDIVKSDYFTMKKENGKYKHTICHTCGEKVEFYNTIKNPKIHKEMFYFDMMTWTGIYKKSFIDKWEIRHNETPGASYQDNGFWFQTFCCAENIVFLDKAYYHYRLDNPNSSINSKSKVFCMCEEYAFINTAIKRQTDFDIFKREFYIKMFFNYMLTYERIANEHKIIFLNRFAEDFKKARKDINLDTLDSWVSTMIYRIIDSPENFYYDDLLYKLQQKSKKLHELKGKLTLSKELEKGKLLKKALKGDSND